MIGEQTHNVNNFIYVNKNIYIVFIDINNFIYVNKKISNQKMIITFFLNVVHISPSLKCVLYHNKICTHYLSSFTNLKYGDDR